jgi:hypothetical protein
VLTLTQRVDPGLTPSSELCPCRREVVFGAHSSVACEGGGFCSKSGRIVCDPRTALYNSDPSALARPGATCPRARAAAIATPRSSAARLPLLSLPPHAPYPPCASPPLQHYNCAPIARPTPSLPPAAAVMRHHALPCGARAAPLAVHSACALRPAPLVTGVRPGLVRA